MDDADSLKQGHLQLRELVLVRRFMLAWRASVSGYKYHENCHIGRVRRCA